MLSKVNYFVYIKFRDKVVLLYKGSRTKVVEIDKMNELERIDAKVLDKYYENYG